MAQFYDVVFQHQTVELLGGTRTVPVMEIGAETKPSGIYWQKRVNLSVYVPDVIDSLLASDANVIEEIARLPTVAGIVYVQDVNLAGLLIDELEITVTDSSGASSRTLIWPVEQLFIEDVTPAVDQMTTALDAVQRL